MFNINKSIQGEYKAAAKPENPGFKVVCSSALIFLTTMLITLREMLYCVFRIVFRPKPDKIANQLVLVTGGANGLGRSLSIRFAQEGCDVAICDLDYNSALTTVEEIREKFKVTCKAFHCDISNYAAILKLKSDIETELRPVDILVNNAGLLYMSDFMNSKMEDNQRVIDVNLTAQIKVSKYCDFFTVCFTIIEIYCFYSDGSHIFAGND